MVEVSAVPQGVAHVLVVQALCVENVVQCLLATTGCPSGTCDGWSGGMDLLTRPLLPITETPFLFIDMCLSLDPDHGQRLRGTQRIPLRLPHAITPPVLPRAAGPPGRSSPTPEPHGRADRRTLPPARPSAARLWRWALPPAAWPGGPWRRPASSPNAAACSSASGRRRPGDSPSPLAQRRLVQRFLANSQVSPTRPGPVASTIIRL
jgi:hypothetical protein